MDRLAPPASPTHWRVIAAAVRGTHHEKTNQPCQDALQWHVLPGNRLVAAVADGAGSAALAEVGAGIACRTAIEAALGKAAEADSPASDEQWRRWLTDSLQAAREAVFAEAKLRNLPVRELATTLTLILATGERAAAAQIGDGAVLIVDPADHYTALTRPCPNEYLNETVFLVSDAALENAQVELRRQPIKRLAAFSDGLQMLALRMPAAVPHPPFFSPLFRFVETTGDLAVAHQTLRAFLRSPRLVQRADDDLTLLLASLSAE